MHISKFRKKPVVIQAEPCDGSRRSAHKLQRWMWQHDPKAHVVTSKLADGSYQVEFRTTDGNLATVGKDVWLIRGTAGEFYPCKSDIFCGIYDPAGAGLDETDICEPVPTERERDLTAEVQQLRAEAARLTEEVTLLRRDSRELLDLLYHSCRLGIERKHSDLVAYTRRCARRVERRGLIVQGAQLRRLTAEYPGSPLRSATAATTAPNDEEMSR